MRYERCATCRLFVRATPRRVAVLSPRVARRLSGAGRAALSARSSDHGMANGVASAGLNSVRLCARLVVAAFLSFIERTCFEAEKVRDEPAPDGEGEGEGEDDGDGEGEGEGDAPAAPPPPPPGVRGGRAPPPPPPPPPPRCCDFEAGVCMANENEK